MDDLEQEIFHGDQLAGRALSGNERERPVFDRTVSTNSRNLQREILDEVSFREKEKKTRHTTGNKKNQHQKEKKRKKERTRRIRGKEETFYRLLLISLLPYKRKETRKQKAKVHPLFKIR